MDKEYNLGGVKVYYYPCNFFYKRRKAFYSSQLIKKVNEEVQNHDIIHIHGTRHAFSFFTALSALKHNKKYIITPHASLMKWWMDEIGTPFFKKIYMKYIESYTISNSSALHFLSSEERLQSEKYIYNANSFVVSNGIDIDNYKRNIKVRNEIRDKYNVKEKNILLFLGRIHPQKNLHIVIDAITKLKKTIFFIVGPIGDINYHKMLLKKIEEKKLKEVVRFIPPVTKEEAKSWYWTADYFVSPSIVEGVSMSIIESLASSLPVIVSKNVANFREIEKDQCGFIVQITKEKIEELLIKIENNKFENEFYANNSEISAKRRHDIKVVAKQMKKNYFRILNE